jgi:hypothetical protein
LHRQTKACNNVLPDWEVRLREKKKKKLHLIPATSGCLDEISHRCACMYGVQSGQELSTRGNASSLFNPSSDILGYSDAVEATQCVTKICTDLILFVPYILDV